MESEDFPIVDVGYLFGIDRSEAGEGMDLLGEVIGEDNDCIIPLRFRKLGDEIDTYALPRSMWDLQQMGHQPQMNGMLLSCAGLTAFHILLHKCMHPWPPKLPLHPLQCPMNARMA